jgi:hypothetical protein
MSHDENDENEIHQSEKDRSHSSHSSSSSSSNINDYRSIEFHHLDAISSSSSASSSASFSSNTTTMTSSSSSSSSLRQDRLQREYDAQQQFVPYSNALWELREKCRLLHNEIQQYTQQIEQLERRQQPVRPFIIDRRITLEKKLQQLQQQDPEYVYHTTLQQLQFIRQKQQQLLEFQQQQQQQSSSFWSTSRVKQLSPRRIEAKLERYSALLQQYQTQIKSAKSCLPQYNYHGLWIGKYGNTANGGAGSSTITNDYDLINITYVMGNKYHPQDMLIATKVTSFHGNVPMDEITFQVPLPPTNPMTLYSNDMTTPTSKSSSSISLPPIPLSPNAASKWGISQLSRFFGYGQVAEPQYQNHHWVPGQFIVINANYFSFAWLPTTSTVTPTTGTSSSSSQPQQSQIFFGRPSPELVLKLLAKKNTVHHNPPDVATNPTTKATSYDSNIIHQILQQQPEAKDETKNVDSNKKKIDVDSPKPQSKDTSTSNQDDYEFPSITAAQRPYDPNRNNNSLQYQREYANRCLDLTYEHILDEIDVQYHNPYGNGIWHHCLEKNGDDDQCYFE